MCCCESKVWIRQSYTKTEIQIRAFHQAISGRAVGFRVHLGDELAALFLSFFLSSQKVLLMTGGICQNNSLPFQETDTRSSCNINRGGEKLTEHLSASLTSRLIRTQQPLQNIFLLLFDSSFVQKVTDTELSLKLLSDWKNKVGICYGYQQCLE